MQALTWNICKPGELLKSHRRIDEIAKDQPRSLWLSADQHRRRLIKEFLRQGRITLNSSDYCFCEISCQCHCAYLFGRLPFTPVGTAAFLALYSE